MTRPAKSRVERASGSGAAPRAAIYARVSTRDQSNHPQIDECTRFCRARGWNVVAVLQEHASGVRERRPSLDMLVSMVRRRHYDVVVVWKRDRLFRSLRHLLAVSAEFAALGVDFVSVTEQIDTTTPAGRSSRDHVGLAIHGVEAKVSRTDFLREMKRPEKSGPIKLFCLAWYLAVPAPWKRIVLSLRELPEAWGSSSSARGSRTSCASPKSARPRSRPPASSDLSSAARRATSLPGPGGRSSRATMWGCCVVMPRRARSRGRGGRGACPVRDARRDVSRIAPSWKR